MATPGSARADNTTTIALRLAIFMIAPLQSSEAAIPASDRFSTRIVNSERFRQQKNTRYGRGRIADRRLKLFQFRASWTLRPSLIPYSGADPGAPYPRLQLSPVDLAATEQGITSLSSTHPVTGNHCLSSIRDSQRLPNRLKARFLNRQNTVSTAIYGFPALFR